jgi:hypothetical protein
MTRVMRELSDPVITVLDGLAIPPERDMPRAAMEAQKLALLAAIEDGASLEPASLAERIQLRLRTILGLFVMSAMFVTLAVTCTLVAAGTGTTKRVVEVTVASTVVTAVGLSVPSIMSSGSATWNVVRVAGQPPSALASG